MSALRDALNVMHEQLWDDDRGMVRLYGIHLVRETALGAFLDLENGNTARAERALREVLKHQYPLHADSRWAGTFKTHADQPDAGGRDADGRQRVTEWRDYDPNWRQFLAVILWVTERLYGHVLTENLRTDMQRAVTGAVTSETTNRIEPEYSNIALMQSWLADVSGQPSTLIDEVTAQVQRDGDIAEYNSPPTTRSRFLRRAFSPTLLRRPQLAISGTPSLPECVHDFRSCGTRHLRCKPDHILARTV